MKQRLRSILDKALTDSVVLFPMWGLFCFVVGFLLALLAYH